MAKTNGERYKAAGERARQFKLFCESQKQGCNDCELTGCAGDECRYAWLDLEYKEVLKHCPFCGGEPVMADNIDTKKSLSYYVRCACGARFASALSKSTAAEMWNRRVK